MSKGKHNVDSDDSVILFTTIALEQFKKEKIEGLRNQMREYFWHIEHVNDQDRYTNIIRTRILKLIILLFFLNPAVMTTGILLLHLRPDWAVFSAVGKNLNIVLTAFYLLFVFTSCALLYTHLFLHIYFNVHIKIQMEFLIEYFKGIHGELHKSSIYVNNVHDSLIDGIKQHAKILSFCRQIERMLSGKLLIPQALNCLLAFAYFVIFYYIVPNLLVLASLAGFLFVMMCYCMYGQLYTDAHSDFKEALLKVPWYAWDAKSKKLFLILLMSAQRKYSISIIPPYCVNRSFILWLYRYLYAIITALQTSSVSQVQTI